MNKHHPTFKPQIVFQILHQLIRLASNHTLKKDDLKFFLKQFQKEQTPKNEFLQVLRVSYYPPIKRIIPLVSMNINSSAIEKNIISVDIYVLPGQLHASTVVEEFGAPHIGMQYFEKGQSLVSNSTITVWNLERGAGDGVKQGLTLSPDSMLLMVSQASNSTSCNMLRLVFQGINNQPIANSFWETIHDNGKSLSDHDMIKHRESEKEQARQKNLLNQASLEFTDTLFQQFIQCQASHLHLYTVKQKTYALFRQGRAPCFRCSVPSTMVENVISRIKILFKMDICITNQYIMHGRYTLNSDASEALELTAQVTPGERGEHITVYRQLKHHSVQILTMDWARRNQLLVRHLEKMPLYIPLKKLKLFQYQTLSLWVNELTQMGFNVLLTSRTRLPAFQSGHCYFNHWMTTYIDKLGRNTLASIRDIFQFDIHIDILSLDDSCERFFWHQYVGKQIE